MKRRHMTLAAPVAWLLRAASPVAAVTSTMAGAAPGVVDVPPGVRPRALVFPRDHGAHPETRIEWWYVTGALAAGGGEYGFQITFFRSRTDVARDHPSAFAAKQLLFAHAAVTDVAARRLRHDQRLAREGFGVASAALDDTRVAIRDWSLARDGPVERSRYRTRVAAAGFSFDLEMSATQPVLLQGAAGFSRKGPRPQQASHYVSEPQLDVRGGVTLDGTRLDVRGRAWLDHEWSDELLDPQAVGWDWIGMNLDDGAALTAFQIRRKDGGPRIYAYAALRAAGSARVEVFAPDEVRFEPLARWTSPRTRATYPVAQRIAIGARTFETRPLFDDQELDSRATAGAVYWEGASTLLESGRTVGRGYLEMTGYVAPMRL